MKKEKYPVIRSCTHDTQWLFGFDASVRTLDCYQDECKDRLEAIGATEELRIIREQLRDMCEKLTLTFPSEKLPAIYRQLPYLFYRIDVGKPVTEKTNTIMDVDELGTLIKYAHEMNCRLCTHPTYCGSRCELSKVFDHILPETRDRKESWAYIDVVNGSGGLRR